MTDLLADLADLHKQATTERSHYYTGKVVAAAATEIAIMRSVLLAIAQGNSAKGKPHKAEIIQEHARDALTAIGVDWRRP